MQFTEADQTQIREIRVSVRVALGEFPEVIAVFENGKGGKQQSLLNEVQDETAILHVKRSLC